MDMVNAVKEALTAMKLDTVGEDIRRSTDEMTRITEMVTNIQQKQNDLQKSLDFTQREYDTTKTKVNTLTLEISKSQHQSRIEFQENRVTELQKMGQGALKSFGYMCYIGIILIHTQQCDEALSRDLETMHGHVCYLSHLIIIMQSI